MIPLHIMLGKAVRVVASDIVYRGILIEVSEDAVELRGEGQWITISTDRISSITIDEG
ncbi:MAG: hypothetical protein HZA12_01955 [Nitrospirae bacterium]|nr:hypothetical protein [Nitrospirota bacterium]